MALVGLQIFSAPFRRLATSTTAPQTAAQLVTRSFRSTALRMSEQTATTTTTAAAGAEQRALTMPFTDYRAWVRKMKMRSRVAAVPFALGFGFASSLAWVQYNPYMFEPDQDPNFDPMNPQLFMGMVDPMIAMIASNLVAMGVGFVVGGSVFRGMWSVFNKDLSRQIQLRTADFQGRLQRHRVLDLQKMGEDFYGEKISSLADYRKWVKAQRAKLRPVDLNNFKLINKKSNAAAR